MERCTDSFPGSPPAAGAAVRGRLWRCLALLLAIALPVACTRAPPGQSDAVIARQLGAAGSLVGLYHQLDALQAGTRTEPLVMLQIGDSHTEGDIFSARMRDRLQARFGNAGRGPLPPGVPTRWYRPEQVKVSMSRGWTIAGSRPGPLDTATGMAGMLATSAARTHAEMRLDATTAEGFDEAWIETLNQPGGGSFEVTVDDATPSVIATAGATSAAAWHRIPAGRASRGMTLRTRGDGPVSLLMWGVERRAPGVIYANLGIPGATISVLDRWSPQVTGQEAKALRPALVVLAFGTNEGFDPKLDLAAYRAAFAETLRLLRRTMPGAAIVVLGPADGNVPAIHRRARPHGCEPDRAKASGRPVWTEPQNLAAVRDIQRAATAAAGDFFWDWSAAMGGACSMDRWAEADPPRAARDHVHLRVAGYQDTADQLFAALMRGYDQYLALKHPR